MTVYFGLCFDDGVLPHSANVELGLTYLGPKRFLQYLEQQLGLAGHEEEVEHLRIEQYRQAIMQHAKTHPDAFYQTSFQADQFATAADLLSRRDELLQAGWSFLLIDHLPARLSCLAELEHILSQNDNLSLYPGIADRLGKVGQVLENRSIDLAHLWINEPVDLLPPAWRKLIQQLERKGIALSHHSNHSTEYSTTDLDQFRQVLKTGKVNELQLRGDGSLLIVQAKRETDIARFMACLLRHNPGFHPNVLLPEKNRTLDNALLTEALPSLGIPSTSLARPSLQVLKLVTCFLWDPIDIYKVMEFVSLRVKPLEDKLANRIAGLLADRPGLQNDIWRATIAAYFAEVDELAQRDSTIHPDQIRQQYNFWFQRDRYDRAGLAPKDRIIKIFAYLQSWARIEFEESEEENTSLLVLAEQARRIVDLLDVVPEQGLSPLELERIVRTIYEPAPAHFRESEENRLHHVFQAGAIYQDLDELIWWDFVHGEPDYFFSRWYREEWNYLEKLDALPESPAIQNQRRVWQRKRPIHHCRKRLVLCIPEHQNGASIEPHPLFGDLQAAFEDLGPIRLQLGEQMIPEAWTNSFRVVPDEELSVYPLSGPEPFLKLKKPSNLLNRESETYSSIHAMLYYPYQYVFRHTIRLRKSSILSVVKDRPLMGNLAHRFLEEVLSHAEESWSRREVDAKIDQIVPDLLRREGATLLAYGSEPTRINFVKNIKLAAWVLLQHLRENGWTIKQAEHKLEGTFCGIHIKGRADLVLEKPNGESAIVDLKWGGSSYHENRLRNEEELQLVLYSSLLKDNQHWPHTAYYVISKGEMIARDQTAFKHAKTVTSQGEREEIQERIFAKMQSTFDWRSAQLQKGQIEIRCKQTLEVLEEEYGSELLKLLEMRQEDAPFDDYRTLIKLVE